MEMSAQIGRRL